MAISGVGGNAVFQAQLQATVAKKGLDVQKFVGDAAIQLIQSASIDPSVGRGLDISA